MTKLSDPEQIRRSLCITRMRLRAHEQTRVHDVIRPGHPPRAPSTCLPCPLLSTGHWLARATARRQGTDGPAGAARGTLAGGRGPRRPDESDAAPAAHLRGAHPHRQLGAGASRHARSTRGGSGGLVEPRACDRRRRARPAGRPCEARRDGRGNGRPEGIKKKKKQRRSCSCCCSLFTVQRVCGSGIWIE
jgi:hypothetical protein